MITTLVLTSVESTAADVPVSFMGKFIAFYRPFFTDLITGTVPDLNPDLEIN